VAQKSDLQEEQRLAEVGLLADSMMSAAVLQQALSVRQHQIFVASLPLDFAGLQDLEVSQDFVQWSSGSESPDSLLLVVSH
jgi:hypothetical protein